MHLAGSPGSYFAYLKDYLEEWSKNKKTRMYTVHGGTKIIENEANYVCWVLEFVHKGAKKKTKTNILQ